MLTAVGVLAVLAIVTAGVLVGPKLLHHSVSARAGHSGPAVLPDGPPVGIIAAAGGKLELLRPDGRARRLFADSFPGLFATNNQGQPPNAYVSPDGTRLVDTGGFVIDLVAPGVQGATNAIELNLLEHGSLSPYPWTSSGEELIVQTPLSPSANGVQVLVAAINGGPPPVSLGTATAALTGDPTGRGAVVAVGPTGLSGVPAGVLASALELREVGHPPVSLLTAPRFRSLLRLRPGLPFFGSAAFSPNGQYLAVSCGTADSYDQYYGVVVVDRSGRVVGDYPTGSAKVSWVQWSSSGELALATSDYQYGVGAQDRLLLWRPESDAPPRAVGLVGALHGALDAPAQWSPDGKRLVIGDERGWYVVDGATGRVHQVGNVPGPPVAWVGATSG